MNRLYDGIISAAMKRYNVPMWLKPYIYKYAEQSDIGVIRQAIGFINVRRRKGEVTTRNVRLPNGVSFEIKDVVHIINQFHYGLETTAAIAGRWSREPAGYDHSSFPRYFSQVAKERSKQARAVRNLAEGLGHKVGSPTKEIEDVFNHVASLTAWPDRMIATNVIVRDSYARPFGFIFYKVFYPVSPEFMRSLGKVFVVDNGQTRWADDQIALAIASNAVSSEHVIGLAEATLRKVYASIQSEMPFAKNAGILQEAKLLRDIAIAYPLHTLSELGVDIDIRREMRRIARD